MGLGRWAVSGGRTLLGSLLEFVYPETCVLCGAESGERPWCAAGRLVGGLSWTDGPHLCRPCAERIGPDPVRSVLAGPDLSVHGGRRPCSDLVKVLGQWKYHGVRGLAWPLSGLLTAAVGAAIARDGPVDLLVPVALHSRRRRIRGFNQAEVLAQLAGHQLGIQVAGGLLERVRTTGQQAKLKTAADRRRNLAGAFVVRPGLEPAAGRRIGLVDDLVTSGATCGAAAAALTGAGWEVTWIAALGVAVAAGAAGTGPLETAISGSASV